MINTDSNISITYGNNYRKVKDGVVEIAKGFC